jgi:hypothetical protein
LGELRADRWKQIAFICRHGHQRLDDVLNLTLLEAARFELAISFWTRQEAFPGG